MTVIDAYVFGVSHHSEPGFNEVNPGLGLGVGTREGTNEYYVVVARYKDSYSNPAWLGMVGARGYAGDLDSWHVSGAVNAGWVTYTGHSLPVVVPVAGFGFNNMNIEGTIMPYGGVQAVGAWLRLGWSIP